MTARRRLLAGNWKMNGLKPSLAEALLIRDGLAQRRPDCDVLICPPATLLAAVAGAVKASDILVGGQDCHPEPSGAHTGDISAEMLADAGASAVIVGHSERRTNHGESDALVQSKARAAHRAGLTALVCIGETEAERKAEQTLNRLAAQLAGSLPRTSSPSDTVIAYEPVWAIGTGLTAKSADIVEAHAFIRHKLVELFGQDRAHGIRILYGGSVKPDNSGEILSLENVDGALVGGASLKASDFLRIVFP